MSVVGVGVLSVFSAVIKTNNYREAQSALTKRVTTADKPLHQV